MKLFWIVKHQRPNSITAFKYMLISVFEWLGSRNNSGYLYLNHLALILVMHMVPQFGGAGLFAAGRATRVLKRRITDLPL